MTSDDNPYRSPNILAPPPPAIEPRSTTRLAQHRVRLTLLFGAIGTAHFTVFYLSYRLARAQDSADQFFHWRVFGLSMGLLLGYLTILFYWYRTRRRFRLTD